MFRFTGLAALLTEIYLGLLWIWAPGERVDIQWLVLLCLLLLFVCFIYNKIGNRRVKLVLRTLLVMGICIFGGLETCIIVGAGSDSYEACADSNYIVILGNKLSGEEPSATLKYRLDKGAELARMLKKPVIVTGGNTGGVSQEADVMKVYLERAEITQVIPERQALDTRQNFTYTAAITGTQGSIVIVTSEIHMFRAKLLARWSGYQEVLGVTAQTEKSMLWYFNLREIISLFRDIFYRVAEAIA